MVNAHYHAHSQQKCQGLEYKRARDVKVVLHFAVAELEEYCDKDLHHNCGRKQLEETHHRAKQLLAQLVPDHAISGAFFALFACLDVEAESEDEHEQSDQLEGEKHAEFNKEKDLVSVGMLQVADDYTSRALQLFS